MYRNMFTQIHDQECFGLLGFNGAGKSTIYKILTDQTKMSAGKAVIYGYELTKNREMVSHILYSSRNFRSILTLQIPSKLKN